MRTTWDNEVFVRAVMPADPLPPAPPARPAPTTAHPILSPPENGKFFVFASCIFHACVKPEADPRTHVKTPMIQTVRCPPNLRIFAKDNLGFNNTHPGDFMNTVLTMMRNQMKASDIVITTANASLDHCVNICKEHKREIDVRLARADFSTQTKMKGMVETECKRTQEEIIALTRHALDAAAKDTDDPFNGIAIVLNHADRCNWLLKSLTFKTMSQPVGVSGTSNQLDIANFVSYGAPKTRYLPTKTYHLTYHLTEPDIDPRASAEKRFIHRAIEGRLHLTVGLRLDDRVHTLQANVDLSAFAAKAAGAKNSIAMHEIVQVLMDPRMKARVAELMCKQHRQLPCERLQELEWDVALFDGGCSGIMGPSGYPDTIHVPSSGKGPKQVLLGTTVPSKQSSQPNAVSWDVESPRPASDTLAVRLRKADTYLSPGEPLHSRVPGMVSGLSVFSQTPSAPRSNESTTAEPPSSPRTSSDLEGGKKRRSTTPKKSKSKSKSKVKSKSKSKSKSPKKRGYLTSTKSEK